MKTAICFVVVVALFADLIIVEAATPVQVVKKLMEDQVNEVESISPAQDETPAAAAAAVTTDTVIEGAGHEDATSEASVGDVQIADNAVSGTTEEGVTGVSGETTLTASTNAEQDGVPKAMIAGLLAVSSAMLM